MLYYHEVEGDEHVIELPCANLKKLLVKLLANWGDIRSIQRLVEQLFVDLIQITIEV